MEAQVIFELRNKYKVADLIKTAGIPRSTYYYWTKHKDRPDKYAKAKEAINKCPGLCRAVLPIIHTNRKILPIIAKDVTKQRMIKTTVRSMFKLW